MLGVTEVWRGDGRVDLGSPKRRALVAALALSGGRPVSVDGLVDLLWGDHPPEAVAGGLQVLISGLRRVLEPERAPRAPSSVVVTVAPGTAGSVSVTVPVDPGAVTVAVVVAVVVAVTDSVAVAVSVTV